MSTSPQPATNPVTPRQAPTSHVVRWLLSYASFGIPQAAAPIAFSLLALPLTGDTGSGAAMILALTLAQAAGAVPVARMGSKTNPTTFLRVLVTFRTLAYGAIAVLAGVHAGFPLLIAASALAGLVGGAAYGYQRSLLNHLVTPSQLPRALGIAATLNEGVFVAGPVLASLLGAASPVAAVVALAILGAGPLLLIPGVSGSATAPVAPRSGSLITPPILLWLCCAAATGVAVAVIEIGAVALAVHFGTRPAFAFVFTVSLCIASVAGGIWVSVVNRPLTPRAVIAALGATALGSTMVASNLSVPTTVLGAVVIGAFLAPLGTHYSLTIDRLAPAARRAETFGLLRTATSASIIFVSVLLTAAPLQAALITCTGMLLAAGFAVALATSRTSRAG